MYKLINDYNGEVSMVYKPNERLWIPINKVNTDYQAYLKWLEEGNQPEAAD